MWKFGYPQPGRRWKFRPSRPLCSRVARSKDKITIEKYILYHQQCRVYEGVHGKFRSENCFVQQEHSTNLKYPELGRYPFIKSGINFRKIGIRNGYVLKLRWHALVQNLVKYPPPGELDMSRKDRFESTTSPKCWCSSTFFTGVLLGSISGWSISFLFLENIVSTACYCRSGLNDILQLWAAHCFINSKSRFLSSAAVLEFLTTVNNDVSSAKSFTLHFKFSVESITHRRKNKGPKIDPWGTPTEIFPQLECVCKKNFILIRLFTIANNIYII